LMVTRRTLLGTGLVGVAAGLLPGIPETLGHRGALANTANPESIPLELKPAKGRASFFGSDGPTTEVWCYNDRVPGPEIHISRGETFRALLKNNLPQDTTIHWHGLRIPFAMDGVPGLTQPPVRPGEDFLYEFDVPDAGTYWYHPHGWDPQLRDGPVREMHRGCPKGAKLRKAAPTRER